MRAGYQAKSPAVCYLIDHNLAFDPQCDISEFDLHVFSPRHRDWVYDLLDDLPEKDAVLNSVTSLLNRGSDQNFRSTIV
ncbi:MULTISPECIES: HipA family kinase [Photorhabdus]|uniref:HipA family kinase n=1 Tax=Photorhabdus TaxID=29487 RepID=UPI002AA5AAAD